MNLSLTMNIFSSSSTFDQDVEKATNHTNTSEDWDKIMEVVDKIGVSSAHSKDYLRAIIKRLQNADPHVVVQTISLLDACINNCSKSFHLAVASREFEQEYVKLLQKSQPVIKEKLKKFLKKWSENEFASDPQLKLIPELYATLRKDGVDFNFVETAQSDTQTKDPNAVSSQQEVDDIAKAIELSLKESSKSRTGATGASTGSSLYSNANEMLNAKRAAESRTERRYVRALYDFEAAEDNELTFVTGELIEILDDSDQNWWKGVNHRGEGLFPANFVTKDLTEGVSETKIESNTQLIKKNRVHFDDSVPVTSNEEETVAIDEQKIDRLLLLLHEANPMDESADTEEMHLLEGEANVMGPMIDAELEKVDRKHAQLTNLSANLVDALNLYHSLMREPIPTVVPTPPYLPHLKREQYVPGMPIPPHNMPGGQQMMYANGVDMNGARYSMGGGTVAPNHIPEQYMMHAANTAQLPHPQPYTQMATNGPTSMPSTAHHFMPIQMEDPGMPPVQQPQYQFQSLNGHLPSYNIATGLPANMMQIPVQSDQQYYQQTQPIPQGQQMPQQPTQNIKNEQN